MTQHSVPLNIQIGQALPSMVGLHSDWGGVASFLECLSFCLLSSAANFDYH